MRFLALFAQMHADFRLAELRALANMEGVALDLSGYSDESPFLELDLPDEAAAIRLVRRSILVRYIYKIYAQGPTIEDIHAQNQSGNADFAEIRGKSFKVDFQSYLGTREATSQRKVIEELDYMDELDGPVRLKNPDMVLVFVEQYDPARPSGPPLYLWFTRLVTKSNRSAMDIYDLKKRRHIGTTSFDAELALITANTAQVRPGGLVFDPFAGTGSFPLAAAHFGGTVFCADIDFRSLTGYEDNFDQYGTSSQLAVCAEMDFTHNAVRRDLMFDAIICDPPYGVRERIVVCGAADPAKHAGKEYVMVDGELAYRRREYCATKKPYPMSRLLGDLMQYAADHLVSHGRLAFWLPVDYEAPVTVPPQHQLLKHLESCVQRFGKWERWLLVYERRVPGDVGPITAIEVNDQFREYYMRPKDS